VGFFFGCCKKFSRLLVQVKLYWIGRITFRGYYIGGITFQYIFPRDGTEKKIKNKQINLLDIQRIVLYLCTLKHTLIMKEVKIEDLIKVLEEQVKKGVTKVHIKGTLVSPQDGNLIILSTEKQM
jgi:hypothetical protein